MNGWTLSTTAAVPAGPAMCSVPCPSCRRRMTSPGSPPCDSNRAQHDVDSKIGLSVLATLCASGISAANVSQQALCLCLQTSGDAQGPTEASGCALLQNTARRRSLGRS